MEEIRIKEFEVIRPVMERVYHPKMIEVLEWWEVTFPEVESPWTSMYRPGDDGVHGTTPCRGLDRRSRNLPLTTVRQIEAKVNDVWEYDAERPRKMVCVHHDSGKGPHFHLQVHDNTRLRPQRTEA